MCDVDYNVELNVENKSVSKSNKILICQKCNIYVQLIITKRGWKSQTNCIILSHEKNNNTVTSSIYQTQSTT